MTQIDYPTLPPPPTSLRARIFQSVPRWLVPLAALSLICAATIAYEMYTKGHSNFTNLENLINILRQWSFIGIIAIGMTFVIVLGGIDLSVGSLLAFLGGIAILMNNFCRAHGGGDLPSVLTGYLIILALGIAAGLINGILITYGRMAPFIATLAGLAAYRSLALTFANAGEYRPTDSTWFDRIGTSGFPIPMTNISVNPDVHIPLQFPWPAVIFLLLTILAAIVLNRTRFGRYVIAIGANERAAVYSAINVRRIKLITYMLAGLCTAIAALLLSSRMDSISSSQSGTLYELDAIAAVAIGGTRLRGGAGTIIGTLIGVLILGVIGNMLLLLQVSVYLQGFVKALIIIAAVLMQRAEGKD